MNMRLLATGFILLLFSGCYPLSRLDEISTLQQYAKEKKSQDSYVAIQDQKFRKLLTAIQDGSIVNSQHQKDFRQAYGEPVLIRPAGKDCGGCEEWLYRATVDYFDSDKVYLLFDSTGTLVRWTLSPRSISEAKDHGTDIQTGCSKDSRGQAQ